MRDVIARALSWVLSLFSPHRPGRHSVEFLAARTPEPADRDPWAEPWPTPTPDHVRALYTPLRGEDVALARPYVLAETTVQLRALTRERRRAAALAAMGMDYPYTYEGAPFPRSAFVTGVSV